MSSRLEIGAAVLFLLGLSVAIWAGSRHSRASQLDTRSSTFLTGPLGSKALYDVLTRMGRPTERRRTSLRDLTNTPAHYPAVLAILDPVVPLDDQELDQVVEYVRRGGAVVTSGYGGGIMYCVGWRLQPEMRTDSIAVRAPNGVRLPRASRVLTAEHPDTTPRRGLAGLRKGDDDDDGRPAMCNTLASYAADTIVAAVNNRPVVMRLRYRGGGAITLVSDAGWFTNAVWRDTDVPMVLLGVLTPPRERPGRVVWDEYHQGFGDYGGPSLPSQTWSWLSRSPAGWAILQLIAVALVWLATMAVRFGPAQAVIERRRRSQLEHLEALGAGLESAEDADTAVQRLALGLRRRLSRTGQPPATTENVVHWLEGLELAMRAPSGRTAVRRLQHLLRARSHDEARVLDTAQAVEDVWEELRPRARPKRNGS